MGDPADVLAAAARRAAALVAGEAAALTALHHPELRWTTYRGILLDRSAYVAGNTDGSLRWLAQRLEEPSVVVVGDTAVLTAVVVDEVSRAGRAETHRLRLTQTWLRTADGWVLLAAHAGPPV